METILFENKKNDGEVSQVQINHYPLLPFPPSFPTWKGSARIRGILNMMLTRLEYGGRGPGQNNKLGWGEPPLGWPDNILWGDFTGATRSKLVQYASYIETSCVATFVLSFIFIFFALLYVQLNR